MSHSLVRNKHKGEAFDVYVGRPSKWGNPFVIGQDGNRDQVIAQFRAWLPLQPHLMGALHELRGKRLGCFCSPEPCHADVLAELANRGTEGQGSLFGGADAQA